jgi:hypothetical protein
MAQQDQVNYNAKLQKKQTKEPRGPTTSTSHREGCTVGKAPYGS